MFILGAMLAPPMIGEAHHNACTNQGSSDPNAQGTDACPEFSPSFNARISYPYRNTPATVALEFAQDPHEAQMLRWEAYLPKEWRFNTTLREGLKATSDPTKGLSIPATTCDDLFKQAPFAPSDTAAQARSAPYAEAVSSAVTMTTWNNTAGDDPSRNESGSMQFGGPGTGAFYLRTSGNRTTLCVKFLEGIVNDHRTWVVPIYLDRVDLGAESPYGWRVSVDIERIRHAKRNHANPDRDEWWTEQRDPVGFGGTLTNPARPPTPIPDYSITSFRLILYRQTGGTWNLVNGVPAPVVFSRAPRQPLHTRIGMRALTCTNGAKTLADGCDEDDRGPGTILQYPYPNNTQLDQPLTEFPFVVNLPPVTDPQPWARITKIGDVQLPGVGKNSDHPVAGFGFADGLRANGNRLSITWPALATGLSPGVETVGYALVIRKVTRHQSASTQAEEAAGRVLYKRELNNADPLVVSFDLDHLPENAALGNVEGKYDVSLVTIYNTPFGNGYRSDGLCDGILSGADPIDDGRGVPCPLGRPIWLSAGTSREGGVSSFQAIVREETWPRRYLMSQRGQPFQVLLVDPIEHQAELIIWGSYVVVPGGAERRVETPHDALRPVVGSLQNSDGSEIVVNPSLSSVSGEKQSFLMMGQGKADDGASTVFGASGALMFEPTGPIPGLIQFGTPDIEGEGFDNWWFAGRIGGSLEVPFAPDLASSHAYGVFEQYAPRNSDLDWLPSYLSNVGNPESCLLGTGSNPEDNPLYGTNDNLDGVIDEISRGCGPEDAYPETITSDFVGIAF